MKLFVRYLGYHWRGIALYALCCLVFGAAFWLYHLPLEAVGYPAALCGLMGAGALLGDFFRRWKRYRTLENLCRCITPEELPPAGSLEEEGEQALIAQLCQQRKQREAELEGRYEDMVDYYTLWAHQIKTPISSMRLRLQNEDTQLSRQTLSDLFRIEQYVEMVLTYLRLESSATDYVIRSCSLDDILRPAVKKFAGEFIGRRLRLNYRPVKVSVLTDEKWLSFVVEQVLSNSLKYTREGEIAIYMEEGREKTLAIRDTGIGIAPEDLPRIFEKGFTGYNGRDDKRASGIGLYLCKRICGNLGHTITARSTPGEGTVISIDLSSRALEVE